MYSHDSIIMKMKVSSNCRRRSSKPKDQRMDLIGHGQISHSGIKAVSLQKNCKFSSSPSSVLCLCIVTWNMNGKLSTKDFIELVGKEPRFDLLAIGLQEAPRQNIAQLLQSALTETHSLLGEATMQSLQLFLFGPKNSEIHMKEVKIDKHAVGGYGGLRGRKKGAVAIYINFNGVRMIFVCCHLSAHEHKVEKRNSQCRHISEKLFSKDRNPYSRPSHLTVWLGDLNYRIHGISTLPVRSLIQRNLLSLLTSKDQLLQEAERGQVFNGFCEGTLSFKPTYKYNIGSSDYDTSYKIRIPSWTDRILFKVDSGAGIDAVLRSYESIDCINSSDHKPVRAHLCLKMNNVQMPV
ncbi:type IV inositol polyphosphate 5-phosphatase 11-like isoform X2 [Dioscorea cayenensis subsp. rotundata]|uniref:Type IV inositol polyphosphate 5-phosphatase 11-like isoform X2 n=1 Tax=Dioscorea cayennensis subsp. rotundata TaxID=55577 RepID=A0AB40CMQ8_DIOCR|nr:type IV inositol polyphosphate 5-phosphatase 11-like isoform X2 [Dioscorea cayenensis subsp. rotundata]